MDKLMYSLANKFSLVVFILLATYSSWKIYELYNLKHNGEITEGVIVGFQTKKNNSFFDKNEELVRAPIFKYKPINKESYIKISATVYKKHKNFKVGDKIQVYYMTDKLQKAQIKDLFPWKKKFYMLLIAVVGLLVTTLPFFKKIMFT